jgi:ZIP family zinc transporter
MLLLRRATSQGGTGGSVGLGLVVAVVADVLVDGVLIGLSVALATGTGLIFALALAPEMGLLGLTAAEGVTARLTGPRTIAVSAAIGVAIAAGGAVGWAVAQAPPALGTTVLGVGASVVMNLVLEELLREAHRNESGVTEVAVLFGCFLPLFLAGVAVG